MSESEHDLIVVGAGLSGLSCAQHAARIGLRPLVLDAADRPGGRVATDEVEGLPRRGGRRAAARSPGRVSEPGASWLLAPTS